MQFCSVGQEFWPPWSNHGLSLCFFETVGPVLLLLHLCICCLTTHYRLLRSGMKLEPLISERWPKLFRLQVLLGIFIMPSLYLTRLILQSTIYENGNMFSGYMLVNFLCNICNWLLAIYLTFTEQQRTETPVSTGGHSISLLIFYAGAFIFQNLHFVSWYNPTWWFSLLRDSDSVELIIFISCYISSGCLFILSMLAPGLPKPRKIVTDHKDKHEDTRFLETGKKPNRSAFEDFSYKMKLLIPFIWPKNNLKLQLQFLICVGLLVAGRCLAVVMPIMNKKVINSMIGPEDSLEFRWDYILLYTTIWFIQGQSMNSLLSNIRSFFWLPIQQFTMKTAEVELFTHLHKLSLRWHMNRKTGEVIRVCDRGRNGAGNVFNILLFSIMPTLIDIFIAVVYFTAAFNAWFGLVVFLTMVSFLAVTFGLAEWRTKYRRTMNKLENAVRAKGVDSLLNYETVKYYNTEVYEVQRYKKMYLKFQDAEWTANATMILINTLQSLVTALGVLSGSLLCARMVADREFTVGDYTLFNSYILQLCGPLNWFGNQYRMIQQAFIDMENMFELMRLVPEIQDVPNALPLKVTEAEICFKNVSFSYLKERQVLKNISFVIPSGKTVGLVGPSGSGKSTVIRLLFRMYNLDSGSITFDGQDIAKVQQRSLRKYIGVVPQDSVLFNDTIHYNISYGRIEAQEEEIQDAARAADIHDPILNFPKGYQTIVGERGLKLSGGEKQRVAIARTILKNPALVLLDEATSSLDTRTEQKIKSALNKMCTNRTTLIVAHRLSTIVAADFILVLREGEIVERGTHDELLDLDGLYAAMWDAQQKDQQLDFETETKTEN